MRTLLALAIVLGVPASASALPAVPLEAGPSAVTPVQNRFLPGFLGGGNNNNNNRGSEAAPADARILQLEEQVRMLTGQVEQLTFTVRRLEQAVQQMPGGQQLQQQGAVSGPGAPPRSLGTLPADGTATPGATTPGNTAAGNTAAGNGSGNLPGLEGPIDLSVLNNGGGFGGTSPTVGSVPSAPASTPALDSVRRLQDSGRYAMAADEARAVLAANPDSEVAGEARYLLGEALLAQGDYRAAANQFLENYTSDPNNARAPASLLQLGKALNGLGEREAACSSLDELFGAYPNVDGQIRAAAEREREVANCA